MVGRNGEVVEGPGNAGLRGPLGDALEGDRGPGLQGVLDEAVGEEGGGGWGEERKKMFSQQNTRNTT